jgi:tetratricopeptide (TPR) repeat protein
MNDHVLTKYEDACDAGIEPRNGGLWFPISTETTIASAFERVQRSKGAGGWRNWFSSEDCRYFADIAEIRRYAQTCGYDLSEPVAAVQVRDARVGSEYVRRLVGGQRKRFSLSPFEPRDQNGDANISAKLQEALTLRLDLKDSRKAFEAALCACVAQPRDPAVLLELGIGALLNGSAAAAQCALAEAISLFPHNPIAWNYLAESYRASGRLEDAVEAGREAIRLEPDSADHNQLLGSLLNQLGRWEEAEKHLRFAVESPGGVENFKWALVRNLFEQGRYQEALDILQKAQRALGHSTEYDRLRKLILLAIERSPETVAVGEGIANPIDGEDSHPRP